ncbi:helix-turn-helix transcriptional regulator [Desulfobotulus sp. H1]|uniref:Helix-turn-helix transcriptional regulator n=1 Tax=Desulfobotulus pelophilus TaxID=2823377 RepID=A0ABT3N858_9BACT|nr:helix-turn-helix transcriptional regulator [Desulfobotulus pelophilus]
MQLNLNPCPVGVTLALISDKWKIYIIHELQGGPRRPGEMRRLLKGISQKVLTENLRSMEKDGLLIRAVCGEVPPRVEYSLTELGGSLSPGLEAMFDWGSEYLQR